jgi:hypothetical protein
MLAKIAFGFLWIAFSIYAFIFAPPNRPDTFNLIVDLASGNWNRINPLIIALFNVMGVLPAIYACFLLFDGRGQKISAFPFVTVSFGVGAFAILPYLALRQPNPNWKGQKNLLLEILDSPLTGLLLALATIILIASGLFFGNWADYWSQFQSDRFIHVMSLDFCLLSLLFPAVVRDDLRRRGINNSAVFTAIALVPLLGTLVYLCFRPPLSVSSPRIGRLR